MPGICGLRCSASSAKSSRDSSSARTYRAYSVPDEEVAYAAGLIDGEGCISIYCNRRNGLDFHYVRLTVQLSYKGLPTLKRMQSAFGGSIASRVEKRNSPPTPFYVWRLGQQDACRLLYAMLPYMGIKRANALLALHFNEVVQKPLDDQKRECAARCKQQMHRLNKTGMPGFPDGAFAQLVGETWVGPQMTLEGTPEPFSGPWPASGSMRNGACWEQTMSVPRIDASGCGYWPTARTTGLDGGSNSRAAAKARGMWPTATVDDANNVTRDSGQFQSLTRAARGGSTRQTYPTPNAGDADGRYARCKSTDPLFKPEGRHAMPLSRLAAQWGTPNAHPRTFTPRDVDYGVQLANQVARGTSTPPTGAQSSSEYAVGDLAATLPPACHRIPPELESGSLSPQWVEWLQGWIPAWTDSEHSVTDRCLRRWLLRSRTWLTRLGY